MLFIYYAMTEKYTASDNPEKIIKDIDKIKLDYGVRYSC